MQFFYFEIFNKRDFRSLRKSHIFLIFRKFVLTNFATWWNRSLYPSILCTNYLDESKNKNCINIVCLYVLRSKCFKLHFNAGWKAFYFLKQSTMTKPRTHYVLYFLNTDLNSGFQIRNQTTSIGHLCSITISDLPK